MLVGEGKPSQIKKWKKQRAERGFSDYDVYEIDTWFLTIIPEMIDELIKRSEGYPSYLQDEYLKEHKLDLLNISDEEQEQMDKACFKKWKTILRKMKQTFIKSSDGTYDNPNRKKALGMFVKYFDDLWY